MSGTALLDELGWRRLIHLRSEGLEQRLAAGPISAYIGFDASATSLHVGHLLQVFLLTHLQRAGGRPVVLIGGGTGMIGDPSGKSSERVLLDAAAIERNSAALRAQLERFLDFSPGPSQPRMVNNLEWLGRMTMIDYLRDIGKFFTVPYMLAKDSVQARLAAGMSFTEFSYQTLQAADFLHLHQHEGVDLQMGGADQWGNITAGLELIRRVENRAADGRRGRERGPRAHRLRAVQPAVAQSGRREDGQVGEGRSLPRRGADQPLRLLPVLDQRRRRGGARPPALAHDDEPATRSRPSRPSTSPRPSSGWPRKPSPTT